MESFESISKIFGYLLPIVGVICVIVLIVVLINVNKIIKNLTVTVTKANTTVDGVNEAVTTANGYLKDFDVTVKAVNNVAMSVEAVRATTERVVKRSADKVNKQYTQVKTWVTDFLEKKDSQGRTTAEQVRDKITETAGEVVAKVEEVIKPKEKGE